ncbi:hypothetical protein C0J52_03529 [Blattella germanica]|nr:hypothetical protein C0J52_03529 [Blattella germanica]
METSYLIDTKGCRIQDFDPFGPQVRRFVNSVIPRQNICNFSKTLLVKSNITSLWIDNDSLKAYGLSDTSNLNCCYIPFEIKPDPDWKYSDKIFNSLCIEFKNETTVSQEYVSVICMLEDKQIFKHYYSFFHESSVSEKSSEKVHINDVNFNVLIIGLDAVSRLNFHRHLKKSLGLLKELGAIELLGYNKVQDETFPNIVPLLSGLSRNELENVCWLYKDGYMDECPWIWKNFSSAKYITGYGEDCVHLSLFVYNNDGFEKKPTDFYIVPFMEAAQDDIGSSSSMCSGNQMSIELLLDNVNKFYATPTKLRKFGFFWSTSVTHDDLNYANYADDPLFKFLHLLKETNILNNTVLLLLSDHGLRNDEIRQEIQGYLEDRLPFSFFIFPQWFKDLYPKAFDNLKNNAHRLVTTYDFHKTLLDLITPSEIRDESIEERNSVLQAQYPKPHAISLFLSVHENRTCQNAKIPFRYCACYSSEDISLDRNDVREMSNELLEYINSLVKSYKQCAVLTLIKLKTARIVASPSPFKTKEEDMHEEKYFVIAIQTVPGNGIFEGMFSTTKRNRKYELIGNVTRINKYRNQSACINVHELKYYCYCLNVSNNTME